ncbi:hypothetical protein CH063_08316 [Colletotrichum higginsianum]|uniref:Uncharacterized protein n=1 Tax=Colletotrichum higginsianum (strain IMI 349063) TaxID=759273 RepID=H1V9D7_COLHI|nr:hypothetical protein CH063_08316 [Colletotrichum higginsianum]
MSASPFRLTWGTTTTARHRVVLGTAGVTLFPQLSPRSSPCCNSPAAASTLLLRLAPSSINLVRHPISPLCFSRLRDLGCRYHQMDRLSFRTLRTTEAGHPRLLTARTPHLPITHDAHSGQRQELLLLLLLLLSTGQPDFSHLARAPDLIPWQQPTLCSTNTRLRPS